MLSSNHTVFLAASHLANANYKTVWLRHLFWNHQKTTLGLKVLAILFHLFREPTIQPICNQKNKQAVNEPVRQALSSTGNFFGMAPTLVLKSPKNKLEVLAKLFSPFSWAKKQRNKETNTNTNTNKQTKNNNKQTNKQTNNQSIQFKSNLD